LLRKIGGGSYGEVWLARNTLGTLRAVKIVYRHVFEDNRPFEREFRGIQRFEPISRTHEGLVDILQVGSAEDYFYYVMELADPIPNPNPESRNPKEIRNPQSPIPNAELCDPASYAPRTLRAELKARGGLPASECVGLGLGWRGRWLISMNTGWCIATLNPRTSSLSGACRSWRTSGWWPT
jgi:eukaryotic-like serine/threonine-protein kinase